MKKQTGMYWHCHHDQLCEYVYDYQERVDYIKKHKPQNEIAVRLKLFKPVKGKLPQEFVAAGEKYVAAREKWDAAREKWDAAQEKWDATREKYIAAQEKYVATREKLVAAQEKVDAARKKHKVFLEKLHAKECGCKEWNGKEIVFKRGMK